MWLIQPSLDFKWAITSLLTGDFLTPLHPSSFNSDRQFTRIHYRNSSKQHKKISKGSNIVMTPALHYGVCALVIYWTLLRKGTENKLWEDVNAIMEVTVNIVLTNATGCLVGRKQSYCNAPRLFDVSHIRCFQCIFTAVNKFPVC